VTKPPGDILPPWSLAIAAIFSIQLSSALAVSLIDSIGAGGAAWLRTTAGALLLLLIARPRCGRSIDSTYRLWSGSG